MMTLQGIEEDIIIKVEHTSVGMSNELPLASLANMRMEVSIIIVVWRFLEDRGKYRKVQTQKLLLKSHQ